MKKLQYRLFAVAIAATLFSCSNDNNNDTTGNGKIILEFDNAYGANDLILNTQENTTSNNEVLKINTIKYLISNVVLTKADGTTFTYPKSKSFFIADEASSTGHEFELEDLPAADYIKVQFNVGASDEQLKSTNPAITDFLTFEGSFTSTTQTTATPFAIHTAKTTSNTNNLITLNFPTKALVRSTITPEVHLITDLSKILDGPNKIKLSGTTFDANVLILLTQNLETMFRVDHVHND